MRSPAIPDACCRTARLLRVALILLGVAGPGAGAGETSMTPVLDPGRFRALVESFQRDDEELYPQAIPNTAAWAFLESQVPRFECPDAEVERTYWFRWWTFRKHLRETPDGRVITEFLPPVPWAGKHNTISCAAGHHFQEGRWLRDTRWLDEYARFWFRGGGDPRRYSFWAAEALWARYAVTGDPRLLVELLPDLVANAEAWEKARFDPEVGLFWQEDGQDGMEVSVGGSGYRVTINSYQYGDALAVARIADLAGQPELAARFRRKAADLKRTVLARLWDPEAGFFKVLPRGPGRGLADVRELHGLTPWYFGLADPEHGVAWRQMADPLGFKAPYGLTTAEQRHPGFTLSYEGHECQWNGPSWPYATAVTLTAAARVLQGPPQDHLTVRDYFEAMLTYARAHRLMREDGRSVPWIDENLNPFTGDWIARTRLKSWNRGTWSEEKGGRERGKDYNHSTFADLVISGLVGLRPRVDDVVEVWPLVPEGVWEYFALEGVPYHGRSLTVLWDREGKRYGRGAGLRVWADGHELAATHRLARIEGRLPAASAGNAAVTTGLDRRAIEEGWILLFDGQTTFGWTPRGEATWQVTEGTLHPQPGTGPGFLCTTTEFADFELHAEFWIDAVANSGVFLRGPTAGPITMSNAYEVNIFDAHPDWPTGSINEVGRASETVPTAGRWNRYELRAEGSRLTVRLNGRPVLNATDARHARGVIALQTLSGQGVVKFRNLRLRPLGLADLFNGRDLAGWRVIPGHASVYSVTPEGWLNVKNGNGDLQTEAAFGDFVLQLDILSNGRHLNSGVFFRALPGEFWQGYESQIRNQWEGEDRSRPVDFGTGGIYRRQPARRVVSSDGAWFTKTIVAHGRHLAVWVDGIQVSDWTDDRAPQDNPRQGYRGSPGVISLQGHDPTTDLSFRRLRAVELPAARRP